MSQYIAGFISSIVAQAVWFVSGLLAASVIALPRIIGSYREKRGWINSEQFCVFTGSSGSDLVDSMQFRQGDFFSVAKIYGHLHAQFPDKPPRILSDTQIDSVKENLGGHLLLVGGPNNNVVSRRVLEQWDTLFQDIPRFVEDSIHFDGKSFRLEYADSGHISKDFGVVARCGNPFQRDGVITSCMGIKSFGTLCATNFLLSEKFRKLTRYRRRKNHALEIFIVEAIVERGSIIGSRVVLQELMTAIDE